MQKNGSASLDSRIDSLKQSMRNLVDAGGERAGHIKERAIGVKDTVFENGEAAISRARVLIKEHPFAALGIAFGIGYIAIRLLRK
jgi:ElaB/YqjD/DUF883 family membrane-anchored ribosome-binding protein